jgi:hypothetical protein
MPCQRTTTTDATSAKKALVHCTKPKCFAKKAVVKPNIFSRKKILFFATRKDVESYSQMPGKRISALEFSNFSGEGCPDLPQSVTSKTRYDIFAISHSYGNLTAFFDEYSPSLSSFMINGAVALV